MKKTITTIALAAVMTFGATFARANGGIIVAGIADVPPCGTTQTDLTGIIVAGLAGTGTGIIVAGLTGIIVAGSPAPSPCVTTDGIIVAG